MSVSEPTGTGTSQPTMVPESARLFAAQISGNAGFFVAVLLVARMLGPSGRGTVAFVTVSCLVLARIASVGVQEASTYLAARDPSRRGALLVNLWIFTLFMTSVVAALAVVCLNVFDIRPSFLGVTELTILAVGTVIAGFVDAGIAYLYGIRAFASAARVTAVAPWGYVLLLGTAAALGVMSPIVALGCWLATHLAWAIALAIGSVRMVVPSRPSFALLRESLHYGLRAWVGTMARFANFRADQLILGLLASEAVLGIYAVSVNASEMLLYLPAAVASVLVSSVASTEAERQPLEIKRAFRVVSVLTIAATALAVLVGPIVIPLVFGSDYQASVQPFVILSLGAFGYAASAIFSGGLLGASRPGRSSFGPFVSLVLGISLDLLLIPRYGATGAALAATIAFAGGGLVAALLFRHAFGLTARELLPTGDDVREVVNQLRKRSFSRRGVVGPTAEEGLALTPHGQLSMRGTAYYWMRASFERVRLTAARRGATPQDFVRILAYHRISADRDFLAVRPNAFRRQLEILLEREFRPITLRQGVDLIRSGRPIDDHYVCITFDDGYLDNVEIALPHLEDLGMPATIFLPTDVMSGWATYHWYTNPPPPMTWDDARTVAAGGLVSFEAHGTSHRALPHLSDDELREELLGSRAAISEELGVPSTIFCYPAGLHGDREVQMARAAGYMAAVTTQPGVNLAGDDLFRLRRTTIAWSDSEHTFGLKVAGAIDRLSGVETWVRARRARA
jgi:O-antigen/teichoic acid export membrane protein/peptidoglycan/xylan/chitin deacetylase (PgdA/CDA1 family)